MIVDLPQKKKTLRERKLKRNCENYIYNTKESDKTYRKDVNVIPQKDEGIGILIKIG